MFDTSIGIFQYKNLKPSKFLGYYPLKPDKGGFLIAKPEKSLLDTFYLSPQIKNALDGLRLNKTEIKELCKPEKLKNYSEIFDNKRVAKLTNQLIKNTNND